MAPQHGGLQRDRQGDRIANNQRSDAIRPSATVVKIATVVTRRPARGLRQLPAGGQPTTANMAGGWPLGAVCWWARSGQTRYTHVMPPNMALRVRQPNSDSDQDAITASSRHPGVVNCR